jgi:hypothetical protein
MRLAIGVRVHTGWAACLLAGGSARAPSITARETVSLLGDPARFVFHRASEMTLADARRWVVRATREAEERAGEAMRRLAAGGDVVACAVVAKPGPLPELGVVLASHMRIHAAEGIFYRDVLLRAAEACGLSARLVPPATLDARDTRLAAAGRLVGKPWNSDAKLAALAAWSVLST